MDCTRYNIFNKNDDKKNDVYCINKDFIKEELIDKFYEDKKRNEINGKENNILNKKCKVITYIKSKNKYVFI